MTTSNELKSTSGQKHLVLYANVMPGAALAFFDLEDQKGKTLERFQLTPAQALEFAATLVAVAHASLDAHQK